MCCCSSAAYYIVNKLRLNKILDFVYLLFFSQQCVVYKSMRTFKSHLFQCLKRHTFVFTIIIKVFYLICYYVLIIVCYDVALHMYDATFNITPWRMFLNLFFLILSLICAFQINFSLFWPYLWKLNKNKVNRAIPCWNSPYMQIRRTLLLWSTVTINYFSF